jgi:Peptidase family M50
MKCDSCGLESDFSAAFFKEQKAFRKSVRKYCPACWIRRRQMIAGWPQVGIMLAGIIGFILIWFNVCPDLAQALITIFLFNLSLILSIIPHELGHAIAAWLLGLRVFNVVFGSGKQVFKFHLFGTLFSFHWLPLGGLTRVAPRSLRWWRVKFLLMVLAGPAANAIIALTILFISRHRGGVPVPAQLFLIANAVVFVSNLIPRRFRTRNLDSDGLQIIGVFFENREKMEQAHAAWFVLEAAVQRDEYKDAEGAAEWCKKGLALYSNDVQLLNMSGTLCLDRCDYARAREIFRQLLPRESKLPGWRYIILNNIAYADALVDDPSLLPEADAYSEEAYRNIPWAYFAIGTRGTVLVEMGKYEEGIKLLKESIEKSDDLRSKALNTCNVSIAHARLGDYEQADKYLKLARQMDSHCSLLERAAAELGKRQGQSVPQTSVARD